MKTKAYLFKAFTKDPSRGNPAGVILNADSLTDEQMLRIASSLSFSESAFVSKSEKADFKVRFFSPKQEVNFCGHATIATFYTLLQEGRIVHCVMATQETKAGILPVIICKDGRIVMTQSEPQFFLIEKDKKLVASLLSLKPTDLLDYPLQTVSTGTPKLIVPVRSSQILMKIKPDFDGIKDYCQKTDTKGFYPFTSEVREEKDDYQARQFNPLAGIYEDPVTGVAAGALACYVNKHNLSQKKTFVIEQGHHMNKEGKMYVDIREGVKVGGYAVKFGEKEFDLE